MSDCPDREAMLQAYVDNELDAANALAFEAHLKTCEGCSRALQGVRELKARLSQARLSEPAPEALHQRIENLVESETAKPRRARPASATDARTPGAGRVRTSGFCTLARAGFRTFGLTPVGANGKPLSLLLRRVAAFG